MEVNLKSKEVLDYKVNGSNFITKELPKKIINYDKPGVSLWTYGTGHGKTTGMVFKALQESINSKFVVIFTDGKDKVDIISKEITSLANKMGHSLNIVSFYKNSKDEMKIKNMDEMSFKEIDIFICHYTYLGMKFNNPLENMSYQIIDKINKDDRECVVMMDEFHKCIDELKYEMTLSTAYRIGQSPWTKNLLYPHTPDSGVEYFYGPVKSFEDYKIMFPLYKTTGDGKYKEFVRDERYYTQYLNEGIILDVSSFFNLGEGVQQGNGKTKCEIIAPISTFKSPGEFNLKRHDDQDELSNCVYGDLLYTKMKNLFDRSTHMNIRESIISEDHRKSYFPGLKVLQGWYTKSLEVLFSKRQCMLFSADITIDDEFVKRLSYKHLKSFDIYSPKDDEEVYTCSKLNVYFVSGGSHWDRLTILDNMLGLEDQIPFRFINKTKYEHDICISNERIKRHSFLDDISAVRGGQKYKHHFRSGEKLDLTSLPQLTYAGSNENVGTNYERFDWTFFWDLPVKGIFVSETEEKRDKIRNEMIRQCLGRMMRSEGNEKNVVFFIEDEDIYVDLKDVLGDLVSVREELVFKYVKFSNDVGQRLLTNDIDDDELNEVGFKLETEKEKKMSKIEKFCNKMLEDGQYRKPSFIQRTWKDKDDLKVICKFWKDNMTLEMIGKQYENSLNKIDLLLD